MGAGSSFNIWCPTNGEISSVSHTEIQIYIRPTDDHLIFAPLNAKIEQVKMVNGDFINPTIFHTFEHKTGKLSIILQDQLSGCKFELWILVGKPHFITDRIYFGKKEGQNIERGDQIAEILIGSMAGIKILSANFMFTNNLQIEEQVFANQLLSQFSSI